MPQSKSSIGQDISSSFVSSATESEINAGAASVEPAKMHHAAMAFGDLSDTDTSLMTSQDSTAYKDNMANK